MSLAVKGEDEKKISRENEKKIIHEDEKKELNIKENDKTALGKIEDLVLAVLLFAILVLIITQVYFRFFTESSLTWSEELSRFMAIWLVFLGSTVALRRHLHIQVDNLYDVLPRKAGVVLRAARTIVMLAFFAIILMGSLAMLDIVSIQTSPGLGIQMNLVYMILPISMCLMILISLWQLFLNVRRRRGEE